MNKIYKQAYEAPRAESFSFKQSLDVLIGFSIEGEIEDTPEVDDEWGDQTRQQRWR
ncbi:MAG: hypothetical protein HXL25_02390 [Porphyromonadaceae bacterium]|nr:hypothetical protein [Porphyromonadaceae bacterium]